jgi:hypothetical protein
MTRSEAIAFLGAIRRSGRELSRGLHDLNEANPSEFEKWKHGTARALSAIQDELLEPLLAEHPDITPPELGGAPSKP